jgi:hypothetical protein
VNLTQIHPFSGTSVNEAHVGLARQYFPCDGASYNQNWPQKLGLPASVPGLFLPHMNIQGYQGFPAGISTFDCLLSIYTLQLVDNFTILRGKHSLKFGLDIRKNRFNRSQTSNRSGSFNFNSTLTGNLQQPAGTGSGLASFLLGAVASASAETDQPVTWRGYSQAYYAQDDWKLTQRLTLNLGLRWDYQHEPSESHNRISNFNPYGRNPQDGVLGRLEFAGIDFGMSIVGPNYRNFAPRVGFALDVFGNGKTALRGGYGIYYPLTFSQIYYPESNLGFNSNTTSYLGPGGSTQFPAFQLQQGFPTLPIPPLGAKLGPGGLEGQTVSYIQPNGGKPYSQQWTFTVQHELPGRFLLETGYSGNKGTRLVTANYDLNQLDPQYYSLGIALQQQVSNPYAGLVGGVFGGPSIARQQLLRPYPYYGNINVTDPRQGSSTYHAFLLNLEKRMSNGFVLLATYSFGKLINEGTSAIGSSQANGDQLNVGNGYRLGNINRRLERSLDPTDSAKHLAVSSVYELPFGPGKHWPVANRALKPLVHGWQVNGVAALQDGLPLVIRGANNFLADRPNSTGTTGHLQNHARDAWLDTSQFTNPPSFTLGNVARTLPDVRGPGIFSIDLSVAKTTSFGERFKLQFRAESFNFPNHVNLLEPNTTFVPGSNGQNISSTFGTITSARDARILQLGLKLLF